MHITPSDSKYILNVQLPTEIQREMVTVSAKKGNRIAIVADVWHMEEDCHYEWQIRFSPYDINMTSIRVILDDDAQLTIHVERHSPNILSMF
ncbi:hypothetical protein PILCRDRAFT_73151 [Piloderma croceum F 1598]|uniref:SHSP domain-containing protein n=1 Tax=Piloderma croceum (strain F 1598) TaxID=765440 RepID=A0A0C3FLK0_PILCF|nr:hypothetical protein PILCRDRAFT_73151 [Piloderma croceum F 1598]